MAVKRHSYAEYLPELIRTLRVCGRVAEAVKRAQSFVEDTPETAISCSSNANIHIELARCHVALGDAKAAMVSQRKAIGIIESISGPQTLLLIPPLREYETMLEKSGASKDLQEVQTRLQSLGSQREQFVARCRRVLAAGPRPAENSHND